MARRSSTPVANTETEVSEPMTNEPMTDAEIAANSVTNVDPDPAATPETNGDPTEAGNETDEVIDLSAVNSALDAVLGGDLSDLEALDFSAVVSAYNDLSRKGKAAATREMDGKSRDLLAEGNFDSARVILLANKATKAAKPKGESKPRTPADITTPVVTRLAAFQLAYGALSTNLPEGISEDWQTQVEQLFNDAQPQVEAMREWMSADAETRGDAPDVTEAAALAARIAFKATRKPYGPRHDVGKHIEQVLAAKDSGTFMTDAEIAGASSDEYGDGSCSTSAVTARIKAVADQDKPLSEGLSVETRNGKLGVAKS